MKASNTLDSVITENGRSFVRHYLQDVGSSLGTGALERKDPDDGYEHLYEGAPLVKRMLTLGFYIRPWQYMSYPKAPEVGRFEGDALRAGGVEGAGPGQRGPPRQGRRYVLGGAPRHGLHRRDGPCRGQ